MLSGMREDGGEREVWWASLSVRHTKKTLLAGCSLPIVAMVLLVILKLFVFNYPTEADYFIKTDERTKLDNARTAARDEFPFHDGTPPARSTLDLKHTITVLLRNTEKKKGKRFPADVDTSKADRKNVLSRESLAALKKAEDDFYNTEGYERFCLRPDPMQKTDCAGKPRACALPRSITNHKLLYGRVKHETDTLICGRLQSSAPVSKAQFAAFMADIITDGKVSAMYAPFLGNDFNAQTRTTQIVRSFLQFGTPFEKSKDPAEGNDTQAIKTAYEKWTGMAGEVVEKQTNDRFFLALSGAAYSEGRFQKIITTDLSYAGISILLVFVVVWFHTSSLLLANFTIMQIMFSFPLTYFFYRAVFQIKYFAALQIMTIFLILGIGADDVFVFTDAWRQATVNLGRRTPLVTRMSWAYRRAVKAMFVTSMTTAAAFFVTASSPIMPISTLGIWSGLLVLVQLLLVIILYPCALIIWHRFWRLRTWKSCLASPHPADRDVDHEMPEPPARASLDTADIPEGASVGASMASFVDRTSLGRPSLGFAADGSGKLGSSRSFFLGPTPSFFSANPRYIGQSMSFFKRKKQREEDLRPIEKFFKGPWTGILDYLKVFIILLGAGLMGASIYAATLLESPTEPETYLPNSHPLQVALNLKFQAFPSSDSSRYVNVHLLWGIDGIDRSGTSRYAPLDIGKALIDEQFSLRTAEAQQRLLEACEFFEDPNRELLATERTIEKSTCWIRDFQKWRQEVRGETGFVTYDKDTTVARELLAFGKYTIETGPDAGKQPYLDHLTEQRIAFNKGKTRVMFTELMFVSKTDSMAPYAKMWPEYNRWQRAVDVFNFATSAPGMSNATVVGGRPWIWQITQKALEHNMFVGIGVVFGVALLALSLSTGNWVVSFLALVSIAGILTNLLALVLLFGWTLGITESIGVVIAVGFSFDYVAHVANAYVESRAGSRLDRTRDALTDLGISILAGAISTLLAGSMLFMATIIFFFKFGIFVVVTVALSLVWGLFFFPAMLLLVGPTGSSGELKPIFFSLFNCITFGYGPSGAKTGKDLPTMHNDFMDTGSIDGRRTSAGLGENGARNSFRGSLVNSLVGSGK